jgi:hypothetical protein
MKTRSLLFIVLLVMMPSISFGQLGRLIKNTANKAVNSVTKATAKEANQEIDSAAQRKADQIVSNTADSIKKNNEADQPAGKSNQGKGGFNVGNLLANKVELKYNEEYSFTSRLFMQTETYDKNEVVKMDMYMYFSANSPTMGMETKSITDEGGNSVPFTSVMVMDGENKCLIALTDMNGTKMGVISSINDSLAQNQNNGKQAKNNMPANFKKTGNTKVIAGYKCDEYTYTDANDKSSGKVWFTKEATNLKIDKRGWQSTGMANYYGYDGFRDGILLASETYDEKGKLTIKTETKEINSNFSHSISIKGYPLRQMNPNQGQPKK